MLLAIAIYKKEDDQFKIVAKADPTRGLFAGRVLDRFINKTLVRHQSEFNPDKTNYIQQGYEHHYIKFINQDCFVVLISGEPLNGYQLGRLFLNINQVYLRPQTVAVTLDDILKNSKDYMEKDILIIKTRQQIEEVREVILQVAEKLIQRGEAIEVLCDKTQNLDREAINFKHNATKLKNSHRCCGN